MSDKTVATLMLTFWLLAFCSLILVIVGFGLGWWLGG